MVVKSALRTVVVPVLLAAIALPATATGNAGEYLAARQAGVQSDFEAAADYYARALMRDTGNVDLIRAALTGYLSLGDLDRAIPLARRMRASEADAAQLSNLALYGELTANGDWEQVIQDLDNDQSVGPLFDGLLRAWSLVGLGQMGDALEQFDTVAKTRGTQAFGLYHRALALASVGDFEGANAVFSGENGPGLRLTRRGIIAHALVLSQLDRNDEAILLLDEVFGRPADPYVNNLRGRLEAGETVTYDIVTDPIEGIAELHFTIANAIAGEAADGYTLIYARMVEFLRPDHIDGILLGAEILERLENYDLATAAYDQVPRESPYFHMAEIGRAENLRSAGKTDAAVEALTQLGKSHGQLSSVHVSLGDFLRGLERYEEASEAYDRAIALIETPESQHWSLYFSRGITHEREGRWPQAEADFRKALELEPDQPQVLNYLGYSFLEMQTNLEEALDLIERAVEGRPNSGYITDSLGWALYRLGRYEDAVEHMERAVELLPVDPVVNDHLGDVYWAVGRFREAEFQWSRALSFIDEDETTDADPDRVRRKLEVGLDAVLAEEGEPPLEVANDEG